MNGIDPERLTIAPDGKPEEAQPRWRRDFPIDWPQDRYVSQRDFIKFLLLTSLGFVVGQFWLVARRWLRPREEALLSKPIARLGEIPVAILHRREGSSITEEELRAFLEGRLAAFKIPARLIFSEAPLPRLGTGKIDRIVLKQQYAG